MGRIYYAAFSAQSIGASNELFLLSASSSNRLRICGFGISFPETCSIEPAAEKLDFLCGEVSSPSAGTSLTVHKREVGDSAATASASYAATFTSVTRPVFDAYVLKTKGLQFFYAPSERPVIDISTSFGIDTGHSASYTASFWCCWEEF